MLGFLSATVGGGRMQSAVRENEVPCFGYRETAEFWKGLRET